LLKQGFDIYATDWGTPSAYDKDLAIGQQSTTCNILYTNEQMRTAIAQMRRHYADVLSQGRYVCHYLHSLVNLIINYRVSELASFSENFQEV